MNYEERLAVFQLGKIYESSGSTDKAEGQYDTVLKHTEFSPSTTEEDTLLLYETLYRKMILNLNKRDSLMGLASKMIEVFYKDDVLKERVLMDVANIYLRVEEMDSAKDLLIKVIEDFPQGEYFAEASFELAKIYHQVLEEPEKAIPHYLTFLNQTKESKRLASVFLSDCYLSVGDENGAKLVLEGIMDVSSEESRG